MFERFFLAALFALHMHQLRWWREYVALLAALCLVGFGGYWLFLSAPSNFEPGVFIEISEGEDLSTIAHTLYEADVIRSEWAFKAVVHVRGGARSINAGAYRFAEPISAPTVAYRLVQGISGIPAIRITFPEGITAAGMADLIEPSFSADFAHKFEQAATPHQGYLFPDTYVFSSTDTPESIVRALRENFNRQIEPLKNVLATSTNTLADSVRMAAILEREANNRQDMQIVAGILWKRLALRMPLQVDVAPETYKSIGLPERPIANPGIVALTAALYPKTSKYLFYITGRDGKMYYAKTFAEHQVNIERYLK